MSRAISGGMFSPTSNRVVLAAGLMAAGLLAAGCAQAPVKPPPPTVGPRLRVAVVEFENKTTYGQRLGTAAADILVTELSRTDRFILIERAKLDRLLAEQKLGVTGVVDPDTAAKMGRVLGAAAIVTGAVSQFGVHSEGSDMLITESKKQIAECTVDVRVVNVETSQILYAESGKGVATTSTGTFLGLGSRSSYNESLEGDSLRASITKMTGALTERLMQIPWTCRVADVDGQNIYLDAGLRSGLGINQVLDAVQLGDEIKSPTTGLVIGHKENVLGKARVVKHFGEDGAIAEMLDGKAPGKGDLMRLPGN